MIRIALASGLLFALAGCVHKIPGTDIDDTEDTRSILDVIERYRVAVEAKNAQGIVDVADPSFKDNGGTTNPDDDLDFASLHTKLPARFDKVEDLRLDISVRKLEIDEVMGAAQATYSYITSFKMPSLNGKTQAETDLKLMNLKRVDNKHTWKIVSGI